MLAKLNFNPQQFLFISEVINIIKSKKYSVFCHNCLLEIGYQDISISYYDCIGVNCNNCNKINDVGIPEIFDLLRKYQLEKEVWNNSTEFNTTSFVREMLSLIKSK